MLLLPGKPLHPAQGVFVCRFQAGLFNFQERFITTFSYLCSPMEPFQPDFYIAADLQIIATRHLLLPVRINHLDLLFLIFLAWPLLIRM